MKLEKEEEREDWKKEKKSIKNKNIQLTSLI